MLSKPKVQLPKSGNPANHECLSPHFLVVSYRQLLLAHSLNDLLVHIISYLKYGKKIKLQIMFVVLFLGRSYGA